MNVYNNIVYLNEEKPIELPNGNYSVKLRVCKYCHDSGDNDCICHYDKYETELVEFEICKCCGNII